MAKNKFKRYILDKDGEAEYEFRIEPVVKDEKGWRVDQRIVWEFGNGWHTTSFYAKTRNEAQELRSILWIALTKMDLIPTLKTLFDKLDYRPDRDY